MATGGRFRWTLTVAVSLLVVLLVQGQAWAAPGDPDTSFSGDGFQTLDLPGNTDDEGNAILVQANGRIVVGGATLPGGIRDFALLRILANGTIDTSFSGDGFKAFDFRGLNGHDEIFDLAQQPDGKIVAVGYAKNAAGTTSGFAIARLKANGALDPTFSGDGKALVVFTGLDRAYGYAVAIQEDGRILVGGEAGDDGAADWKFAVARLNANGTIDTTYGGGDGRVLTDFSTSYDGIWDMELQPDGKLVAGGWSQNAAMDNYRYAFARYKTAGGLDQAFSADGKQVVDVSPALNDSLTGLEIRPDGKIVGGGGIGGPDVSLVRLKSGGVPDTSFSGDGKLIDEPLAGGVYVEDVNLAAGNKLIITGRTSDHEIFVARYLPGGALDTTFGGGDGMVIADYPGSSMGWVYHSAIQPNGRILVGGYAEVGGDNDFAAARFLP